MTTATREAHRRQAQQERERKQAFARRFLRERPRPYEQGRRGN